MARTARKESEEVEEVAKPDFEKAVRILKNDIHPLDEQSASIRGSQSGAWKAIEKDCHVNKRAAKLVNTLRTMSPELRDDFLRSQYGLMRELKIGISRDLVDMAEGSEETFPVDGETEPRDFNASTEELKEDGATSFGPLKVPGAGGFSGAEIPPELAPMVEAGKTKPKAAKPKLVTVN